MKRLLLILLLFISFFTYSQQSKIDSLTVVYNETKIDTIKLRILYNIEKLAYGINTKLAEKYNDSLINFSKNRSDKYFGLAYRMDGTYKLLNGDYPSSEKSYHKSLKIFQNIQDVTLESKVLGNIATLYGRKEQPEKAKEYYHKSIALNNKNGNDTENLNAYLNLGITATKQNSLEEASKYFTKSLEISEQTNNIKYIIFSQSKLGDLFLKLSQYDKAEKHLNKALTFVEKEQDNYSSSIVHNSFGYLYEARDEDYEKALYHYKKALNFSNLANNKSSSISNNYNVGIQNLNLGNFDKAKLYFEQGFAISKEIKSNQNIIVGNLNLTDINVIQGNITTANKHLKDAYVLMGNDTKTEYKNHFYRIANSYEDKGLYKPAYANMKEYTILADSLFIKNGVDKITEIETKYQTEKKEKENLQLKADKVTQELQLEKENRRKQYFAFALLASLLTLGVFAFYYRRNKKQKAVIENLQKDLHHRVKNNLAIIDSLVEDIKDEFDDKAFTSKLTDLQNRIDSINEVHSQLYMSTDITNLKLKKYVEKLAKNVQQSFAKENISINNTIDDSFTLNVEQSFPVGLIINEFLTNSFKYAFTDTEKGIVHVDIQEKSQNYILSLSDNGKGLPNDFDISKLDSFGVDVMKLLSKQLKGTFSLNGENGVHLIIEFPKA